MAAEAVSLQSWKAPYIASQAVIMDLVEIYFEIVYPIFPLFHRPTYIRKVCSPQHLLITLLRKFYRSPEATTMQIKVFSVLLWLSVH
jgi:hypothetical protein